ncbi:MAG: hypothetical protein WD042_02830 [Phycisphaeraceae bacterium]
MNLYLVDDGAHVAVPALLRQAGIAGISIPVDETTIASTLRDALDQYDTARLALVSVRLTLDIQVAEMPVWLHDVLTVLARRATVIELHLSSSSQHDAPSSPRGDGRAVELIKQVLERTRPHGLAVSLSHRCGDWLERIDDAVRLAMRLNRSILGLTFNLAHWRRIDGRNLDASLHLAAPRMVLLTLGTDDVGLNDAKSALQTCARLGYRGPVGLEVADSAVSAATLRWVVGRLGSAPASPARGAVTPPTGSP